MSLYINIHDIDLSYRWYAFSLYIYSLISIFMLWLYSLKNKKISRQSISFFGLFLILLIAIVTRLYLLTSYPFVSVGDELRDGGFDALRIATGELKNLFSLGNYEGYGNIIPTIASFFYRLFGSSVLTYRIPAAFISIFDIFLMYILLSLITKNKIASFFGSFALVALPIHLFHSRTELVIILNSFFATVLLLTLYIYYKRNKNYLLDCVFLGMVIGFSFTLHGAVKAMGCIVFLIIVTNIIYNVVRKNDTFVRGIQKLFLIILFIFIGFGPLILNTTFNNFFNLKHVAIVETKNNKNILNPQSFTNIGEKYKKSLLIWGVSPSTYHYRDPKPIFSPVLFLLFLLGVFVSIRKKNTFLISVIFIALILHLTNSALTKDVNADHRMIVLLPIGCLFVGFGISYLFEKIKSKKLMYIFSIFLFLYLSYQTSQFFIKQPANLNRDLGDYVSMHAVYLLKSNPELFDKNNTVSMIVSPNNFEKFNFAQYNEQYAYFFPQKTIHTVLDNTLTDNELIMNDASKVNYKNKYEYICKKRDYFCPLNQDETITIFY